ncbi:MAG TPA: hypothetical protein VHY08_22325 [Bacillota bacterium]|nr:hypothetical protein [Bacillota bacterium]
MGKIRVPSPLPGASSTGASIIPLEFPQSVTPRGLALKALKLSQGFEGFLQHLFNPTNKVFFLCLAWDLSGAPVVSYPGSAVPVESCIIPMKVGNVREFLGAGVLLFPARIITAGLAVRIQLWESDHDARRFGKTMEEVASAITNSKLSNLLSMISLATGAPGATIALVKNASLELMTLVGKILQANSDDYVDFYEGYFPANGAWSAGTEHYAGHASEIHLTRLV